MHSKWLHSLLIHFKFEKNAGSFIVISPGGSCPGSLAREQFIASVDSESMAPHKRAQIRPRLRTAVRARPHPSGRGRSDGYAHEFRLPAVRVEFNGLARNHEIRQMRLMHLWCSRASVYRWRMRNQIYGHMRRFRRTGNNRATVLRGYASLHLAFWWALWPRGNHHEANVWLFHAGGGMRFYQPSQISLAEDRIGLSSKRASTTARQAMLPINLQLRYNYWFLPCPYGIANIPRHRIIDLDEAALFVESSNRSMGKAHLSRRVREVDPYGHSEELNILCAICGEDAQPGRPSRRWVDTWSEGGTTIARFISFIRRVLQSIGQGTPNNFYVFTMDNLNSHRNVLVQQAIHLAGHRCVFRAPYYPVDSPIEHIFNSIQGALKLAQYRLRTWQHVKDEFYLILRRMICFASYFRHVGIM